MSRCMYFCHISKDKQERELYGDIGYLKLFSEEVAQDVIRAEKLGVTSYILRMIIYF